MAKVSKITLAQRQISEYFQTNNKLVYTSLDFHSLIDSKRFEWGLPQTTSLKRIIEKWVDNGFIKAQVFKLSDGSHLLLYLYGEPSIYEIAVTLRPKSYISHYPAVFLHELTNQVPKTIYTTQELTVKRNRNFSLTQQGIDRAFLQPQRRSHLFTTFDDYTITLLNGMHSNRAGVLLSTRYKNAFSITNLERTLIDITVRPNYAGGSFAVLEAFRKALGQISSNKLMVTLKAIPFIYPYHQAIGFYLEKAGYSGRLLNDFKNQPMQFNFYLDYEMKEKLYDENWKIWYPKGI
jgi:hypothetical protein